FAESCLYHAAGGSVKRGILARARQETSFGGVAPRQGGLAVLLCNFCYSVFAGLERSLPLSRSPRARAERARAAFFHSPLRASIPARGACNRRCSRKDHRN